MSNLPDRIWACRDADTSEVYWAAPGEIYQASHLVGEFVRADLTTEADNDPKRDTGFHPSDPDWTRGVGVKPLVWQFEQEDVQVANTSARHQYRVIHDRRATKGAWSWFCDGAWIGCETEEAAKAAAQADYEARILAALAPTDAAHVNETPKSEHDGADVLTAAQAREAALREAIKACDYVFDTATETGVAVGAHECRTKIKALMEAKP